MFDEYLSKTIFKNPMPTFEYDMSLYAKKYLKMLDCVKINSDITYLHDRLRRLSLHLKTFDKETIDKTQRVYILDSRLNVLFAAFTNAKKLYDYLDKTFNSNYCTLYPVELRAEPYRNIQAFNNNANNGLVSADICEKFESLTQNHCISFSYNRLVHFNYLSTYEVILFLEKFRKHNQISLEKSSNKFFFLGDHS